MNIETERAIADLQRIMPTLKQNYHPCINRAVDALLASAEALRVARQRIDMLEQRAREQVSA
jgi:hypothetical protein